MPDDPRIAGPALWATQAVNLQGRVGISPFFLAEAHPTKNKLTVCRRFSAQINSIKQSGRDVPVDDTLLAALAIQGFEEMEAIPNPTNEPRPYAMSALQVGRNVYIASSMKGSDISYTERFPHSMVAHYLESCAELAANRVGACDPPPGPGRHLNDGNCAEPCALALYDIDYTFRIAPSTLPPTKLKQGEAAIVTVCRDRQTRNVRILPPCSPRGPKGWGCALFLADTGIREAGAEALLTQALLSKKLLVNYTINSQKASIFHP